MVFHNEDGNPARANIKQALGYLKDGDGDGNSQPHKGVKASANSDVMYFFTSAQDGDPSKDDVRLCLGDDLKKAQDHNYFPATPGNTSPDSSNDLTKYLLATLVFSPLHDDPYMEIMQAYDATDNELPIPPLQAPIAPPTVVSPSPVLSLSPMFDSRDFFPLEEISPPKYIETPVESPIPISPSSSVGSSSPVRSTTPPPDYPFDKSIFAKLDNSLWIIPRPPGSEPVPEESNEMPPKRMSTSEAPAMTQAAIKKLVADSVFAALEA
ncbi:hypothetical protein Tco_0066340 [Tanacetum coccineum]